MKKKWIGNIVFIFFILILCKIAYCDPVISEYHLDYSIDFDNQQLSCTAGLIVKKLDKSILNLLLYYDLKVKSVTDEKGNAYKFEQEVTCFTDFSQMKVNSIKIYFNKNILTHSPKKIIVKYEGGLHGYIETGMLYIKDSIDPLFTVLRSDCIVYPVEGLPSMKDYKIKCLRSFFNYTVSVVVPDTHSVINGGYLESKERRNGATVYTYKSITPVSRIDITIGNYDTISDGNFHIHYFPKDIEGAQNIITSYKKVFSLYNRWFGYIDFKGFSIIEIPDGYGSQTNDNYILQTSSAFIDKKRIYELYHEISHLWNITCLDELPCRLESEGLAMLLQFLVMEKLEGMKGHLDEAAAGMFGYLKEKLRNDPLAFETPIKEYGKKEITDFSYTKGMLFFYLLYKAAGEDAFLNTIKKFYSTYRASGATTEQFADFLVKNLKGERIKKLVDEWIHTNISSRKILEKDNISEI
jgi:hypothetical protein